MSTNTFRRGAIVTLLFRWAGYVVQLATLVILARLLVPADYGLVAMSAAVIGLAAVVGDFGLSLAALQARFLTQSQKSNLFWLNALIGAVTAGVVAVLAPALANFYDQPELVPLTMALSCTFLLGGLAVQFMVEINRKLRFVALGAIELASQSIGLLVAIAMAVAGYGYWALVAQQITAAGVLLVLACVLSGWWPSLPSRGTSLGRIVAFGRDTFAVHVTNYITTNLDAVLVGRYFGVAVLGLYNRAFQLVVLPLRQIGDPLTRVFLPKLTQHNDSGTLGPALLRLQLVLVYATAAPISLLATLANCLPTVVLGEQWAGLGPLIRILAVGIAFQVMGYVYYWAFLARARTNILLVSELAGRIPMVVLMLLVAQYGVEWVAASMSVGQLLIWAAGSLYFLRRIDVEAWPLVRRALQSWAPFALAFLSGWLVEASMPDDAGALVLLVVLTAVWISVVAAVLCIPRYRRDLVAIRETVSLRG